MAGHNEKRGQGKVPDQNGSCPVAVLAPERGVRIRENSAEIRSSMIAPQKYFPFHILFAPAPVLDEWSVPDLLVIATLAAASPVLIRTLSCPIYSVIFKDPNVRDSQT